MGAPSGAEHRLSSLPNGGECRAGRNYSSYRTGSMKPLRGQTSHLHVPFGPRHYLRQPFCRVDLATGVEPVLSSLQVHHAIARGVNFFNWCGVRDGLSKAVGELGRRRDELMVCVQFEARSATDAATELRGILHQLRTDYVDMLTFYYVEHPSEWREII